MTDFDLITAPQPDYFCMVCGVVLGSPVLAKPGLCPFCQQEMDERAAAEHAAQTRALAGDPIAEALRAYLDTLPSSDLRIAEHRAQIRVGNAGRGIDHIKRLVDLGTLPQSSYDAAGDELEAARLFLGLVHEAQQVALRRDQEAEAAALAMECSGCESAQATGPLCDECTAERLGGER
ncbi:hypothetical protein [Micromonospora sp. NPDC050695]|uniref:hypothetical protein n=1 Tax=Micromonospora sp. NPDC050695 TaxID=3154938 RepID=UPI0033E6353A